VRLYQEAVAHARRMRDSDSASLLADILAEEMEHVQEIDSLRNANG
jgi:rubrerythrin